MSHLAFARPLIAATLAVWAATSGSALSGMTEPSAAPVAQDPTAPRASFVRTGGLQVATCYYYRGRYYPYHWGGHYYHYRYHGRYCNHRYYRHGGWYC